MHFIVHTVNTTTEYTSLKVFTKTNVVLNRGEYYCRCHGLWTRLTVLFACLVSLTPRTTVFTHYMVDMDYGALVLSWFIHALVVTITSLNKLLLAITQASSTS